VGRTSTTVEAHTKEERTRSVNLDGGSMGGMDLDCGGGTVSRHTWRSGQRGTHVEAIGTASRCMRRKNGRRGTDVEEEQSARC
jgi:hypothetical protein